MLDIQRINARFARLAETIIRLRSLNLTVFVLLMLLAALGLGRLESDIDQDNWFLEDDALRLTEKRFEDIFGNEDFCAILVEADNVFTPEVLGAIRDMGRELTAKVPYADDVVSVTDFEFTLGTADGMEIINLVPVNIPQSPQELARIRELAMAKPLLRNRIVSEDGRQSWIMLRMKPIPDNWHEEVAENPDLSVGRIVNEIISQDKYSFLRPKATGMPVINVDKRNFFAVETPRLLGISLALTALILAVSLRSARGVIFPLVTAVSSIMLVFGAQGFLGIRNDPSMIFLPVFLSLAQAIGYCIHVFNAFKHGLAISGQRRPALIHAVAETGWPLLFSALTTMAALCSFLLIPLRPIRWVGLTGACLVGVTYVLVIVLLPSLLSFGRDQAPQGRQRSGVLAGLDRVMEILGERVLNRPGLTMTVFGFLCVLCLFGIARFEVSFDVRRTFGLGVPYVERLDYIGHTRVGSLYSYGVAVEFDQPGEAKNPENLKKFDQLIAEIKTLPLTKKTTSLVDIVKDMHQVINNGDPAFHTVPDDREAVAQLLLLYENAGGSEEEKWIDYEYQRLRLMVEIDDYNSGEAVRELRLIQERGRDLFPDAKVLLIGSISQFTVMQDYVTWGQLKSFLIALVVIALLMSLVFGSLITGLIAMIPNIAPALAVGGVMGFANIPLDMMTVTIIPMLLGLAVDDSIHFLNHSQLEFSRTGSYRESIRRVFGSVGTALLLTSLVLILCFSAYAASAAKVFVNMSYLVATGILAALAADYFVTPVLLNRLRPFGPERTEPLGAVRADRPGVAAPFNTPCPAEPTS